MDWSKELYVTARKRARWLTSLPALSPFQPLPIAPSPPAHGKCIVICCDGTANDPKQMEGEVAASTNVYRLYEALNSDSQFGTRQIVWYDPGVGTDTSAAAILWTWISNIFSKVLGILPDWTNEFVRRLLKSLESATGVWIEENIEQGYREIVRNYEPGDRIYIFGFSRGAYTARCIAGLIGRCGLLKAEHIRFSEDAMTLFRRRNRDQPPPVLAPEYIHDPKLVRVHVLGLWDTVASLGLPLWGWWFRIGAFWRNRNLDSNPAKLCDFVYHALSMDEQRAQFFPTVATPDPELSGQVIRQIWLRGAHADVGGGYGNRALANIGFEWMLQVAQHHGLKLRTDRDGIGFHPAHHVPVCKGADPFGKLHDEIKSRPGWIIFGSWPRWVPLPRPNWSDTFQEDSVARYGAPHVWVYQRAAHAAALWRRRQQERRAILVQAETELRAEAAALRNATALAISAPDPIRRATLLMNVANLSIEGTAEEKDARANDLDQQVQNAHLLIDDLLARDGFVFLSPGQRVRVTIDAARVWNRTGVVFESSAIYRIRYVEGLWRDAEDDLCGPSGQKPSRFDIVRRVFWRARRFRKGNWLELIGHVAHPRDWPVGEFGFLKLLKFLFWVAPYPLWRSLIRLGTYLPPDTPDGQVHIVNLAGNGLFYLFANDAWATYKNNSGAVTVEIERVIGMPPHADSHNVVITPRGDVCPWEDVDPPLRDMIEQRQNFLAGGVQTFWPEMTLTTAPMPPDIPDDLEAPQDPRPTIFSAAAVAFSDSTASAHGPAGGLEPAGLRAIDAEIKKQLHHLADLHRHHTMVGQAWNTVATSVNTAVALGDTIANFAATRMGRRSTGPSPAAKLPLQPQSRSAASPVRRTGHPWSEGWTQDEV
jgi:uncharacterized protein (DUF2235 family)